MGTYWIRAVKIDCGVFMLMNEASEPCKSSVASQMTTVVVSSAHGPENQVEIQYSDVKVHLPYASLLGTLKGRDQYERNRVITKETQIHS